MSRSQIGRHQVLAWVRASHSPFKTCKVAGSSPAHGAKFMIQKFFIEGPLPGLNEIIDICRRSPKKANDHKKRWEIDIQWQIKIAKIKPVKQATFEFIWFEKDKRRDKDNIAAGGRKYILDALVKMGILAGDGWEHVINWTDHFFDVREHNHGTKNGGVMVVIHDSDEFKAPSADAPVNGGKDIESLEGNFHGTE